MASVQISKWDVAQVLGLRYMGCEHDATYQYQYDFDFHGKKLSVKEDYCTVSDRDTANEYAAEIVIDMIARAALGCDKSVVKNK
jgi:hypothetical protein